MLIEDLLNEAYQYVITARLQSDPVEDVFPNTGEWMVVGFLSNCEKSKTPRGFCNTSLNFWGKDLTSENQECVTVTEDIFGTRNRGKRSRWK